MSTSSMTKQKYIDQWLRHFAPNLSKKQYNEYVKGQYIWHVFSWKLIDCEELLTGDEARRAFDAAIKDDCICCDMFGSGVMDRLPAHYSSAANIDSGAVEFYVVAADYTWTYVKTHESDCCGPYFLRKQT